MRSYCAVVASLALLPAALWAQADQPPAVKIRADTNAVQVDVAVRDEKRRPVLDLTKENFKIKDEGKPRAIQIFSVNSGPAGPPGATPPAMVASVRTLSPNVFSNRDVPPVIATHSTVILLDGVNGWFENFVWARKAVIGLLDKVAADERIAVYVVLRPRGLGVLQNYTADHEMLLKNVARYSVVLPPAPPGMESLAAAMTDVPSPQGPGRSISKSSGQPPPLNPVRQGVREHEYLQHEASEDVRAAFDALSSRLAAIPGRKSVFWITQGFPPSELRDFGGSAWDKTIAALNQADVAMNVVDSNGLGGPRRFWGPGAILTMQQVAERTGGEAFFHRNDLDAALAQGIEAARDSYTLGFYLADQERDGRFHRLTVSTNRPHLELQYRQGYYSGTDLKADPKAPLESAILSPVDSTAVGITAGILAASGNPRGTLRVRLALDLTTLTVKQLGDICSGKVDEMFVQMNESGHQLAKVSDTREFRFPERTRAQEERQGLLLEQTLPLMEGVSRLSIVVKDTASGQVGSLTVPIGKPVSEAGK